MHLQLSVYVLVCLKYIYTHMYIYRYRYHPNVSVYLDVKIFTLIYVNFDQSVIGFVEGIASFLEQE